jgi:hypothetical protein
METTLSERKELLIKEIISLIKNFDYSKGDISFENKIEIDYSNLYRDTVDALIILRITGISDKSFKGEHTRYTIYCAFYAHSIRDNEPDYGYSSLNLRQFKKLFNDFSLLDLFLIKMIIKQTPNRGIVKINDFLTLKL